MGRTLVAQLLIVGLALLAACNDGAPTSSRVREKPVRQPAPGYVVMPGSAMAAMLHQCSRGAPLPGEATWRPSPADIAAMDDAIGVGLRALGKRQAPQGSWPHDWARQYIGIVRLGHRFIYGSFAPLEALAQDAAMGLPADEPFEVCDGGPSFFGAEYNVAAGRITRMDFNGPY